MAIQSVSHLAVYVRDQAEALAWYRDKFNFAVCDDNSDFMPGFRWLTVAPQAGGWPQLVLMPPMQDGDEARIGGNGFCVLATDDCRGDCEQLRARGVRIVEEPGEVPWGISAVVLDLYGNPYNLVQPPA
ncbi:VOC family protein [Marinobacterium rhizophilum]|uniref:VOC family protein n=1 Tax=Marinobacterium rhizophilum TaxID=420402 RepID=A0ABY5HP12_9GAMM|nr:VOC family protein [Marinobacterium rhizophilum]UTW13854.1 VOC family protein [Marinobacterium rhizophilum]